MSEGYLQRSGLDRRASDMGPPVGWRERRRNPERRMPEVEEISIAEFKRLMSGNRPPSQQQKGDDSQSFDWEVIRKL